MYRLGERRHSRRKMYVLLAVFLLLLTLGIVIGVRFLHADTVISDTPKVVTRKITYDTPKTALYEGTTFKITLPAGWKTATVTDSPTPTYVWHGTSKEDNARWIDVYVDADLTDFSLNRVVSVQANGSAISVTSEVSDNCVNFTGGVNNGNTLGRIQAKWQGIPFLCETGNYSRNVTGVVSADGINIFKVTGTNSGEHRYMFAYTDNSSSPDFKIFTDALKSFVAK